MHSCVSYGVSMFGIYVIQYKILTSAAAVKMCSSVVTRTVCLSTVGWPQAADMTCLCPDGCPFVLSVYRVS